MNPRFDNRLLAIAAGFTAGHVYPAIAIADEWKARGGSVLFVAAGQGLEETWLGDRGWRLETIDSRPFFGVGAAGRLSAVTVLARSVSQCRRIFKRHRPARVLGMGAHVSAGALFAARSLGIRALQHEANVLPGLANRLVAPFVQRSYLGFAAGASGLRARFPLVVGTPVRRAISARYQVVRPPPRLSRPLRLAVLGGSLGSPFLDQRAAGLVAALARAGCDACVLHRCTAGAEASTLERYRHHGVTAEVTSFIDDMASVYQDLDFVITSAGASTLAELAVIGLPGLLVPLAMASEDHQRANAEVFSAGTGLPWCTEADWDPEALALKIRDIVTTQSRWKALVSSLRAAACPDAAKHLVRDLMAQGGEAEWCDRDVLHSLE